MLLPQPDNLVKVSGKSLPVLVFKIIAVVSTLRSLIHVLVPDGGAGSIAGMELSSPGSEGVIFAFGLWGDRSWCWVSYS
jgi:hypothetical protein